MWKPLAPPFAGPCLVPAKTRGPLARAETRGPLLAVVALALGASFTAGCSCNPACEFRGTINEPDKLSMRRAMLRKAMGDVCKQMTGRNVPLRLSADSPVIGRFYPKQCTANDGDQLALQFSGFGYGWTNLTKKLTFTSGGAASYRYDFQVTDGDRCDIYAYFRPTRMGSTDFKAYRIEAGAASFLNAFTNVGDSFGRDIVGKKLGEGFTVIAYDGQETNTDFSLGVVPLGKRPQRPFQVRGSDRITVENERTEIHQNQRDFIGPIVVEQEGRAIHVTARLDGAPAVDVAVLRQADAEAALAQYYEQPSAGPINVAPIAADVLQAGVEMKRSLAVPPGIYYVLLDNTATAGQVAPPNNPLDDRAAVVNYLIQIGDP